MLDVHCEIAYAHTGGLPVGISELCHAVRRATARIHNDGRVEYRQDPQWFSPYMRSEDVEWDAGALPYYARPNAGTVTVKQDGKRVISLVEVNRIEVNRVEANGTAGATGRPSPNGKEPASLAPLPAVAAGGSRGTSGAADRPEGPQTFHLTVPVSEADVRRLRAGDIVFLTGCIFTARDGVYDHMLRQGNEPPIDIRNELNVTTQSSPAGSEVAPGRYEVTSLQATAGFRYAQWMDDLLARYGVRVVINKGGMSQEMYRKVFEKHGAVCLSTMPYGIGAVYGKAVTGVRDVIWKEELGMSEAMWLLEVEELGPLLVEGDTLGNSYTADHAGEVNAPLAEIYRRLPELILKRFGEVQDPSQEMIT